MLTLDNPHAIRQVTTPEQPDISWTADLSMDEVYAIVDYTQIGYRKLNAALNSDNLTEDITNICHLMDNTLAKAPEGTTTRPLYRVQHLDALPQVGDTHTFKSYASTSTDPSLANNYFTGYGQEVIFEIVTSKGVDINAFSVKEGREREILLPRNTSFKVHNVVTTDWVILLVDEEAGVKYDYAAKRDVILVQLVDEEVQSHQMAEAA